MNLADNMHWRRLLPSPMTILKVRLSRMTLKLKNANSSANAAAYNDTICISFLGFSGTLLYQTNAVGRNAIKV